MARCCIDILLGDNMRRIVLCFVLCLGCASAPGLTVAAEAATIGSETSTPLHEEKYQAYVEKIAEAERENSDNLWAKTFPSGHSYEQLVAAGAENIEFCIRFLSEREDNGRQKLIAIYSMHELGVDDYVVFVRKLVEFSRRGLLSDAWLLRGLYSRHSGLVFEQYQNPKIQALLKEMAAQDDISPAIKKEIRFILSGEMFARKRKNEFDRDCMRWSEMRSISACASLATQILKVYAASWVT